MATKGLPSVLQFLRRVAAPAAPDVEDGPLLHRFAVERDPDAFAALVRRHGPRVWGVCRRVLHRPEDAEDAFQATFLVLARRAGALARPDRLSSWLYRVAYRTALAARGKDAGRRGNERPVVDRPVTDPTPEVVW